MTTIHLNRVSKELSVSEAMTLTRDNLLITDPEKLIRSPDSGRITSIGGSEQPGDLTVDERTAGLA